ncbi:MAG: GNAT family N-acetyltransferase [Bacillota bacterium]
MEVRYKDYLISSDKSLLDLDAIKSFLANSYWAKNRPPEVIEQSIERSLCFGVYHDRKQIGFARVVTDWATIYWIGDVFVLEEYRGLGIGKKLIDTITGYEELKFLKGILATADAHQLYEQFGFVREPDKFMVRRTNGR